MSPSPRLFAMRPAALLSGLASLAGCSSGSRVKAAVPSSPDKDRHAAPDFTLKDADGKTVHLSDYKGKVVLLDFWATWCGPCQIEIPWFMDIERQNKDKGFEVLGVSMDDEGWEAVKPFLAEMNVNYRVVIGNDARRKAYGGVDALPTTFLIDGRENRRGPRRADAGRKDFEDGVQELLQSIRRSRSLVLGLPEPAAPVAAKH